MNCHILPLPKKIPQGLPATFQKDVINHFPQLNKNFHLSIHYPSTNYIPMYTRLTLLKEKISNNAFDYEERQKSNPLPFLVIPSLLDLTIPSSSHKQTINSDNPPLNSGSSPQTTIPQSLEKLKVGHEVVFEALDDEGTLKSCLGLEHFLKIQTKPQQNIYIFDNHNHAFYFWHLEKVEGRLQNNATLIHIDQHKDTRIPIEFLSPENSLDLKKVYEYTNTILNVGNFIPPAIKTSLIKDIIFIDSETSLKNFSLEKFQTTPQPNLILDIDIDFFAPELDYIGNQLKLEVIKKILPFASTVTIATSPFFIDQELAIKWIKKIFS
jgi:hypothetical protein